MEQIFSIINLSAYSLIEELNLKKVDEIMNEFMYLSESEKFSGGYIIIPNELYTLRFYKGLSNDAILLYGILLNRFKLSKKNYKIDKNGRVYVVASIASIMELLDVCKGKARKVIEELETYLLLKIEKEGSYNNKRRFYLGSITKEKTLRIGKKIYTTQGSNNELNEVESCTLNGSNNEPSKVKICTMDGSNNELSGGEICTIDGSNNELSRGQNMYPNKNINKNNIKNSKSKWESSEARENTNEYDFSD